MTDFLPPLRYATPDFVLRSFMAGDGAKWADAVNSSHEHLGPFMEWARDEQSVEAAEVKVRQSYARYLRNEDFGVAILAPDESEIWGGTGFHLWEGPIRFGNAELSMWIRASQAGKGLATAALKTMIQWAFTEWQWTRLAWRNDVDNIASQRTAERGGMTREGTLREFFPIREGTTKPDSTYYAILKSEWLRSKG
jgi:RimJ/RimL family protein N-acetyltransferase